MDRKVLIIDDDELVLHVISDLCQTLGLSTHVLRDCSSVLKTARDYRPDLITLDLSMPQFSGEEVLEFLKNDPELCQIPIVVISSLADDRSVIKGLKGVEAFLVKPIRLAQLKKTIEEIFSPAAV